MLQVSSYPLTRQVPTKADDARARHLAKKYQARMRVWLRSNGHCWYCGIALDFDTFHSDHVTPKSKGGGNGRNLVPTCQSCNCSKRDRDLETYRRAKQRVRDGIPSFTPDQIDWLAFHGFHIDYGRPYLFWFEKEGYRL